MKIATVCTGIGSPEMAIKNLGVKHEIVFACEKDKYARQTYEANFAPSVMYDDMTTQKWDLPEQYADLFIGGIPCQAFSLAGKRLGELDPRGLLFYDFYRYVKNQQPKVFVIENVKGLLSDANGTTFQNWVQLLGQSMNTHLNMFNHPDSLLYNLHYTVLNSKNFGVPQNRERVFLVGVRNDLPNTFRFPIGKQTNVRLKDILEHVVDEKYYLSEKSIEGLIEHKRRNDEAGNGFGVKLNEYEGICSTVKIGGSGKDDLVIEPPSCIAMRGRGEKGSIKQQLEQRPDGITNTITSVQKDNLILEIKEATKKGFAIAKDGDSVNIKNLKSETRRGRVGDQIANTIETQCNQSVIFKNRIRRLTPLETARLQSFPDNFIWPVSDTQQYKQCGNSITVNVMQAIIKNILPILI